MFTIKFLTLFGKLEMNFIYCGLNLKLLQMSETLDGNESTGERSGLLSALCVLTFIGSGVTAILGLIGIFASGWVMSILGGEVDKAIAEGGGGAAASAAGAEAEGILAMGTGILIAVFVVVLLFGLLKLFGAIKMWKLQKSGFWMYTIPSAILIILMLVGGSYLGGIIGIGFIVGFGMNLKHMS